MSSNSNKAGLRKWVQAALDSALIDNIDFFYNGSRFSASDYMRVSQLVRKNIVHVGVKWMKKDVEAEYHNVSDTLFFKRYNYGLDTYEKGTIVHEATHCILDIRRSKITAVEEEVIAYIAQASYVIAGTDTEDRNDSIHGVARKIVKNMWKNDPGHLGSAVPKLTSSMPEIIALATMILNDSAYQALHARPGRDYENNGVKNA